MYFFYFPTTSHNHPFTMMYKRNTNLQSMCLNVVVDNINIFTTPCAAIDKQIQFLRRRYSEKLFELFQKNLDSKEYLVWLISPHWKNVSLPGRGYKYSDVLLKLKYVGDDIASLNLQYSSCNCGILSAMICCLPNLTSLNLSGTSFRSEILLLIRKVCPNLHTLNVSNSSCVTDEGLRAMCFHNGRYNEYPSLKVLNVSGTRIHFQTICFILECFTSLEVLNHYDLPTVVYHIYAVNKFYGLCKEIKLTQKKLNLTYLEYPISQRHIKNTLEEVVESFLMVCPFIDHISIQGDITKDIFQFLTKFECLKKIKMFSLLNTYPSTSPLLTVKGATLTHLEIIQLSVSADVITNLCPNLEYLLLSGVAFEEFASPVTNRKISQLKHLNALVIKHTSLVQDIFLKSVSLIISSSENLSDLSFHYVENFTDALADVILKLPNLLTVDLSFTDILPETLLKFFYHPEINKICTNGCPKLKPNDKKSSFYKLISHIPSENTCSWLINYNEPFIIP